MDRSLKNLILVTIVGVCAVGAIQFIYAKSKKLQYKTTNSLQAFAPPALAVDQFSLHPLFVQLTEIMPEVTWQGSKTDIQFALKGTSRSGIGTAEAYLDKKTPIDELLKKSGWEESQEFLLEQSTTSQRGYVKHEQGKEAIIVITTNYKSKSTSNIARIKDLTCPCPYNITIFYAVSK